MAKIIHTSDKIALSKIDMATLHAIAERDGLTEIPDYAIFVINPQIYDEALEKTTKDVIKRILEMSPDEISQLHPAMRKEIERLQSKYRANLND